MLLMLRFSFRFERILSTVDFLLFVQESEIARSRDRSQNAKNRRREIKMMNHTDTQMKKVIDMQMKMKKVSAIARERAFENSTLRQFSRFERVLIKTTTSDKMMMNTKTTLAVHRADSASDRGRRQRRRRKEREEREERKRREKRRRRRREREQPVSK
jgi:hypothetical protein